MTTTQFSDEENCFQNTSKNQMFLAKVTGSGYIVQKQMEKKRCDERYILQIKEIPFTASYLSVFNRRLIEWGLSAGRNKFVLIIEVNGLSVNFHYKFFTNMF